MKLQEKYKKEVVAVLRQEFGYANIMAVPTITKITLNAGVGKALQDPKYLEVVDSVLARISGQQPVKTRSKKSIAAFKIREGMVIGFKVTLRGGKMWNFLDKMLSVTLPRVRDFRGINPKSFDGQGNYSLGFKDYIAFPEIRSDEVEKPHGLEVVITTTAKTNAEAFGLLKALGFPFNDGVKEKKVKPKKEKFKK
ncbi:MAG: 50S ribosomal protein L5 [Patescibacteria group bacterium]|jgi:large subunit ribosomal protein L5